MPFVDPQDKMSAMGCLRIFRKRRQDGHGDTMNLFAVCYTSFTSIVGFDLAGFRVALPRPKALKASRPKLDPQVLLFPGTQPHSTLVASGLLGRGRGRGWSWV